jgi:hypothetical protein
MQLTTLTTFKKESYRTLIYPQHLITPNLKLIEFKPEINELTGEKVPYTPLKGFLAMKDDTMYLLEEGVKEQLPIRVSENLGEMITKDGNVVDIVSNDGDCYKTFAIRPQPIYSWKEMVEFLNLKHTEPEAYMLMNNIFLAARAGRLNCCISTPPSFGKSIGGDCADAIYDLMPKIDAPRTAPAIAPGISTDGVLRIDELSGLTDKAARAAIDGVLGGLADWSEDVSFGTAGSKAYHTMNPPPTTWLSAVITYNKFGTKEEVMAQKASYSKRNDFFDWMFPNSTKINDRFVRFLLPEGRVNIAQFNEVEELSDELRVKLRNMAKSMMYYTAVRRSNFINPVTIGDKTYPAELSRDDLAMIDKYVYTVLSEDSRHSKTMREILIFTFLLAEKDYVKFVHYANKYVEYMKAYERMVTLDGEGNAQSSLEGPLNAQNSHLFKDSTLHTKVKKVPKSSSMSGFKATQDKEQGSLTKDYTEELI